MSLRLGILGGTFDPVHLGHLQSARATASAFDLDRVLMVLAARPPHKPTAHYASVRHRLAMLELATSEQERLETCDIECRREGPSWTLDTVAELSRRWPAAELYLILGIDAYLDIDSWRRPDAILEHCNIVVTTRAGEDFPSDAPLPPVAARKVTCYDSSIGGYKHRTGHILVGHPINGLDVSASTIRRRLAANLPVEHLTGPAVASYISRHGLYREKRQV